MGPAAAFLGPLQGKAAPRAFSAAYRPRWGLLISAPGRAEGRAAAVAFRAPPRPRGPPTARGAAALVPFPSRESIKGKAKLRLRECDVGDKFSHLPLRKASVLLPLLLRDGALCLLLTVRSMQMRRSPGEVCFPGGKREEMDKDEIDTALREAKEEVGLQPEKVEVICRLVPGIDKMNHLVTPVVGFIEDTFQASPNPDEVSDVFVVPLEYFIKPLNYVALPYKNSSGYLSWMHCFTYDDHERKKSFKIWGLTAHFAVFLAIVIFRTKPTFEVHYDLDNLITSAENGFMNLYASINERNKSSL
ncbi:peroxisomal coenzyme A diphosphatase NUDT7 isoform X1 [Phasianus colchicus]|uniref:peroxisomal coenzyme A diphosphatase NUDT7 isoform X1 n=1 Tax=Phasianus colchicus TaxID=9054 RepID=UPI00129E19B8|nr:peroxisomal coenzyme A diphosphatase NUDT7 isoform X1 [Phasianus colchicus]